MSTFGDLFGIKLVTFWLLCILSITIQVVVNHKYLGHFVMVLYYLVDAFMGRFGFEHKLYDFAGTPGLHVLGHEPLRAFPVGHRLVRSLLGSWAVLLAIVANLTLGSRHRVLVGRAVENRLAPN